VELIVSPHLSAKKKKHILWLGQKNGVCLVTEKIKGRRTTRVVKEAAIDGYVSEREKALGVIFFGFSL
jgi:hypothetical protein